MSLQRYTAATTRTDVSNVQRYTAATTRVDCDSVKRYNGSAWVDVWTSFAGWNLQPDSYYRAAIWEEGSYLELTTRRNVSAATGCKVAAIDYSYKLPSSITSFYVDYEVTVKANSKYNAFDIWVGTDDSTNAYHAEAVPNATGREQLSFSSTAMQNLAGKTLDSLRLELWYDEEESLVGQGSSIITVRVYGIYVNGVKIAKI